MFFFFFVNSEPPLRIPGSFVLPPRLDNNDLNDWVVVGNNNNNNNNANNNNNSNNSNNNNDNKTSFQVGDLRKSLGMLQTDLRELRNSISNETQQQQNQQQNQETKRAPDQILESLLNTDQNSSPENPRRFENKNLTNIIEKH